MNTTRNNDLDKLEEARDSGNINARNSLERAFEQSKDYDIERGRKLLIQAHRDNDFKEVERLEVELMKLQEKKYGK